jgi:hypothetical protein
MRIVQQLAELAARVLGLRKKGHLDEAVAAVEQAARSLAGVDLRMIEGVATPSVAALVGDPDRIQLLARLAAMRAEVEDDRGDAAAAASWRRRSEELLEAAGTPAE